MVDPSVQASGRTGEMDSLWQGINFFLSEFKTAGKREGGRHDEKNAICSRNLCSYHRLVCCEFCREWAAVAAHTSDPGTLLTLTSLPCVGDERRCEKWGSSFVDAGSAYQETYHVADTVANACPMTRCMWLGLCRGWGACDSEQRFSGAELTVRRTLRA